MKIKLELTPNRFIEIKRNYYLFSLFIIGMGLGILFMALVGGSIRMGIGFGFVYSIIFILTDFLAWEEE